MRIRSKLVLAILAVLVLASLVFSVVTYQTQKSALLKGIDEKLLTAAHIVQAALGENYHDAIENSQSVNSARYHEIVDYNNRLCVKLGIQYLWSVMIVNGEIVFTSATSPGKDAAKGDHAKFFDIHRDPQAFDEVFRAMKPTFASFHNEWGHGRMVLVPGIDKQGRKYCFGASVDLREVHLLVEQTMKQVFLFSLIVLASGLLVSMVLAGSLSKPIVSLTTVAERIAGGELEQHVEAAGSREINSLAHSIEEMSRAVRSKISELQEQRENLDITLMSIGDGVIATDAAGKIVRINAVAEQLTGWRSRDAQGRELGEVFQVVSGDTGEAAQNPVTHALEEGRIAGLANNVVLISKNGERRQVEDSAAPMRSREGKIIGAVLVFRDVTEKYQFREERRRLTEIIETTTDLVATAAPEGRLSYINRAGRVLLGLAPDAALEHLMISDFHPSWVHDIVINQGLVMAREQGVWLKETIMRRIDGTEIPVSQLIMAHKDANGVVRYYSTIARDISEQKREESRRKTLESQLQHAQKLETIGTLAGGIAHDFNNILMPIIGYVQLALLELPPEGRLYGNLRAVEESAKRGSELVKQILILSGRAAEEKKVVSLEELTTDTLRLLRASVPSTIEIRQNMQPGCGAVYADPTQIRQVIMNLVTNAYQAIGQTTGIITINLESEIVDGEKAETLALLPGKYLRLEVCDTGSGIEPELLARIFEPFFTTKPLSKGTGLGLSVVRGIVQNHGGAIQVQSEPGAGASFAVYLPEVPSVDLPLSDEPSLIKGNGESILIVDDEGNIRALAASLLMKLGFSVFTASSGIEALQMLRQNPEGFDLVVTDQTMPQMTGLELAVSLRQIRPDLKIVLMSGYSDQITEERLQQCGISRFLPKPVAPAALTAAIHEVLGG